MILYNSNKDLLHLEEKILGNCKLGVRKMDLVNQLRNERIIAIIRGLEGSALQKTADALIKGGIRFLEVTMNTNHASESIAYLKEKYGESTYIGAGTVLNVELAKQAIEAGATYLITPNVQSEVITYAVNQGIEIWPGAFTPTEIAHAVELGARAVKVFPASFLGPSYIEAVRGPLDQVSLIAVGGVRVDQFQDYLRAGAIAVGVGNHLIDSKMIQSGRLDQLTERARRFVQTVKEGEDFND